MLLPDEDVVRDATVAVRQLQRLGIGYDDLFSPLPDDALAAAMRRLTIRASGHPLGREALEAVTPPLYGRYLLVYSTDVDVDRQRFALRHGMGHVAAGHVSAVSFLSSTAEHMAPEERVADLFALADLVPYHAVAALKRGGGWRAVRDEIARLVRLYTLDWPEERVRDRAMLRVEMYRVEKI